MKLSAMPAFTGASLLLSAFYSNAALVAPAGLSAGDTYHVVFISSTSRDATSSDISDYDAHVQSAADAAGIGSSMSINWLSITSTETVDAIDHLAPLFSSTTDVPIYNQNGDLISANFDGLWDGSIDTAIRYTELNLESPFTNIWSGTDADGTAAYNGSFGDGWLASYCPGLGNTTSSTYWIKSGCLGGNGAQTMPMFALSQEITVSGVPVPGAVWLFASAIIGLLATKRSES